MILLSADGWSVTALATLIGCCRRTVRRWRHAFMQQGLAGPMGKPAGRSAQEVSPYLLSAMPLPSETLSRLVPVIALTVPEIRRVLNRVRRPQQHAPAHALHWSVYWRYKQVLAKQRHCRKRGATPPPFQQLRL